MSELSCNGDAEQTKKLHEKVVKQIEYYFGDMNLMRDKFMKEKIQEDDGWITIETMLKFNRLKQLTAEPKVICEALKQLSSLMEVSENGEKIRRNPSKPLPGDTKERRDEIASRSIYAKGFPLDSTLDDLMAFFEKYGSVENVYLKRDFTKKTFKGSVFVVFNQKEDAEKFIKEEETKYNDVLLASKLFKAFLILICMDSIDILFLHYSKEVGEKEDNKEEKDDENEVLLKTKQQMTKNAVIHLKGMNPETNREEIKQFFAPHGDVGWVDFDKGVTEGYLRLREPNSAAPTLEKAKAAGDGKIIIHETEIEVRVVEGDEEVEYWKKMYRDIAEKQDKRKKGGGRSGGRGGGRGGRNQRGGRRTRGGPQGKRRQNKKNEGEGGDSDNEEADDDDEPRTKVSKTEAD
ncbi:unnamed protein product [Lymnaea stagnalis]|uniref:Lupus La protein n=1 Tax=Lymnaea stagnalis TaxID=6523 RepID=A0AAV2II57_LYMST